MAFVSFLKEIGDFFLPQVCIFCGSEGIDHGRYPVCGRCLEGFLPILPPICPRCGIPLGASSDSHLCGECIQSPPPFEKAWSLFIFNKNARDLIHLLKFHGNLATLSVVEFLMSERMNLEDLKRDLDVLVPVPMDREGLRRRGYNQALMMAECLSKISSIPVDRYHLIKSRETQPQVGLTRAQRKRNIQGAFSVADKKSFRGKAILLMDDVYTTGATVRACSKALLEAGARSVRVLTFARVVPE